MILKRDFNNGLGFDPISLFIELENDADYPLKHLQDSLDLILEQNTKDLIFHGNIYSNNNFLKWLTAQLIAEDCYISIIADLYDFLDKDLGIFAQRTVLRITKLFPKWTKVLEDLNADDILLFEMQQISALGAVVRGLKNNNSKVKLFFDTINLSREEVLKSGITIAYPFN